MKLTRALEFMEKYSNCPQCGNIYVAGGQGRLIIEDGMLFRSCKCGWEVKIEDVKEAEA